MCRRIKLVLSLVLLLVSTSVWSSQELPYQGRMKIETDRFSIIFEPQDAWAAKEITTFADAVFQDLTVLLDHVPSRKIPVVITSRPVQANGYFSPFPAKVILYITSPANRFIGSRTSSWLRTLFSHELTHYIHLTAPVGPAKFLTPIFGPDVPAMNTLLMPGWWVEGITTYMESTLGHGGRGNSPTFALTYEAPLLEESMWSLSKGSYNSLNPPRGRIYTTGYLMVEQVYDMYGKEAFVDINRRFAAWPFFGMDPAFKKVTGKTASEVYAEALSKAERILTKDKKTQPLFSPNRIGDYYLPHVTDMGLVGQTNTPFEGGQLVLYNTGEGTITPVAEFPTNGADNSAITKSGSHAYISFLWNDTTAKESINLATPSYSDLYRYDTETGKYRRITTKERLTHPAISPDGQKLVAIESIEDRWRLVSVDIVTGKITTLYEHPTGSVYQPSFSVNGESIVAVEIVSGRATLIIIDSFGKASALLPHSEAEYHNPRFIDENTIWFASDMEDRLALYEKDMQTDQVFRLLRDPIGIVGAIVWNDQIIYSTYTASGYALRSTKEDQLERQEIDLQLLEAGSSYKDEISTALTADHPMQKYHDHLRFNVWVPVTMNIPELVPGATAMFRSILGKHVLQASVGYQIEEMLPLANITYQFSPGNYLLSIEGNLNEKTGFASRNHNLSTTTHIPLWKLITPQSRKTLSAALSFGAMFQDIDYAITGLGYLGYEWSRPVVPTEYFGATSFMVSGGMRGDYRSTDKKTAPTIVGAIRGKKSIGKSTQVIGLDIDGGISLTGGTIENLNPIGFSVAGEAPASALFTARYSIPFGIVDKVIPYGGIIGMGLSTHAQKLLHMHNRALSWGDDLYMGTTLHATFAVGAAFTFNASVGVALSIEHPQPHPVLSFNFANLFGTERGVFTQLESHL